MSNAVWIFLLMVALPGCSLSLQGRCWSCGADDVDQSVEIDGNADVVIGDNDSPGDALPEIMGDDDASAPEATEEEQPPACNPDYCPLGCHETEPRCLRLRPSNFEPVGFYDAITGGLNISEWDTVTVNTDDGSIVGTSGTVYRHGWGRGEADNGIFWDIVSQDLEHMISVFGMTSLTLPASSKMIITGTPPAAFYVTGNAQIMGRIETRAQGLQPGPGGGAGGVRNGNPGQLCGIDSHGKGGEQGTYWDAAHSVMIDIEAGGGGGGALGRGGNGGGAGGNSPYDDTAGGAGGASIMEGEALIPLTGGCGGGAGGGPDQRGNSGSGGDGGYGGGGGGAVQISACGAITIDPGGGIDTAGAGGQCGLYGAGGGGGGAGGSILLEAASIANRGLLAANGGGGGTGGYNIYTECDDSGNDGGFDTLQAEGGTASDGGTGGGGGPGGGGSVIDGQNGVSFYNGGGGGGAAGRIRFNYSTSSGFLDSGTCSPLMTSINPYVLTW